MFAIKVVWADGEEEYLKQGTSNTPARFFSKKDAREQIEFMRMGMDDGECQSINVVLYPRSKRVSAGGGKG